MRACLPLTTKSFKGNNLNASVFQSSESKRRSNCEEPGGDLGRDEGSETASRLFLANR